MKSHPPVFSQDLIGQLHGALKRGEPIHYKLPQWGRIHIDRRLPFICVYRKPAAQSDQGTERLLLGQASYILIREEDAACTSFALLLKALMDYLAEYFDACLLFEIWSETPQSEQGIPDNQRGTSSGQMPAATFNIFTSKCTPPCHMLEMLETALLELPFEQRQREVTLTYTGRCQAASLPVLISHEALVQTNFYWVGLGCSPIYRDGETLLPFILHQLHHWLTLVFRRSFYSFSQHYTNYQLVHFNQIGRRLVTEPVWQTDRQLAQIKEQFDILFHVTPVNCEEAWQAFEQSGFKQSPEFNYRPRPIDPSLLKRKLFNIPIEAIEDPTLASIFRSQRKEIELLLSMIAERNKPNFLYGSLQVYGGVELWLDKLANQILTDIKPDYSPRSCDYLSSDTFIQLAHKHLEHYKKAMPELSCKIEIRDDVPGILVSHGDLLIGKQSRFTRDTAEATLAHELGTHMLTYFNGKAQHFQQFYSGFANYESLQEGLAVLAEYLVGGLNARRIRTLAARVIAVKAMTEGAGFVEVFNRLYQQYDLTPYLAFYISMRVFRGGGYTKDAVYLKGLSQLLDYLAEDGELELLYVGKIALEDVPLLDELRWREVLQKAPLLPHYLQSEQNQQRMQALRKMTSVLELIDE